MKVLIFWAELWREQCVTDTKHFLPSTCSAPQSFKWNIFQTSRSSWPVHPSEDQSDLITIFCPNSGFYKLNVTKQSQNSMNNWTPWTLSLLAHKMLFQYTAHHKYTASLNALSSERADLVCNNANFTAKKHLVISSKRFSKPRWTDSRNRTLTYSMSSVLCWVLRFEISHRGGNLYTVYVTAPPISAAIQWLVPNLGSCLLARYNTW